ncbi:hypothetical protein CGLO_13592 [Colletotrichum gloeosporioides Cg-14]|uniref:Uncharacterized protein n=1 Tax=Colletotrichum gloeosporioides (strain Cg-14) TaxID=1237896 RepID=T0JWC1_COLGC|nr:hypothetical protein CGLO_13592 [Colletotrichum gloeosporioides Cg-14]
MFFQSWLLQRID